LDAKHLRDFDYSHGLWAPDPEDIRDDVSSARRGVIQGFAIYDGVRNIDNGEKLISGEKFAYPPTDLKMPVVGQKTWEFCEIYRGRGFSQDLNVSPSCLAAVDSEPGLGMPTRAFSSCLASRSRDQRSDDFTDCPSAGQFMDANH
jgi:hypothetical protein